MKICAYVQEAYAKVNYKNECMETRQFAGLRVIVDCLERAGYEVEYAGAATVHNYDVVLVSLTSDCDWWSFISERTKWQPGNYKVVIGGAGLLHIAPFLPFGDFFIFGRGENLIVPLVRGIERDGGWEHESVACSKTFSPDRIYKIAQASSPYPHKISLSETRDFREGPIGCNHRCMFCGYTWQRRFVSPDNFYYMQDSLFGGIAEKERALLDLHKNLAEVNFSRLRTTSIDGMSERLRRMVNKPITKAVLLDFLGAMLRYQGKPHQVKLYSIVGYPTETEADWYEIVDVIGQADRDSALIDRPWSIVLHCTPFRAMPATPMACEPMSYRNYRGEIGHVLGAGLKGNLIYQGRNLWAVESMGTESLSTVILSAICHRGSSADTDAIMRVSRSRKFWSASTAVRVATLERYFDVDTLFGRFSPETLPSRYLRTYAKVEKLWGKPFK